MKFKGCGVRGNKIIFIRPQYLDKYNDDLIGLNVLLNGTVTAVPSLRKNFHGIKSCGQLMDVCLLHLIAIISLASSLGVKKMTRKPFIQHIWPMTINIQKLKAKAP